MRELQSDTYEKRLWEEEKQEIPWWGIRQLVVYVGMFLAGEVTIAGVYPLIPAIFMTAVVAGLNRGMLFLCAVGGMLLLLPVEVFVRYAMILLGAILMVMVSERIFHHCKAGVAGLLTALADGVLTVTAGLLEVRTAGSIWAGMLECVFVFGFVKAFSRLCYRCMEYRPSVSSEYSLPQEKMSVEPRLREYAESFLKLSQAFQEMNHYKEDFTAEELRHMQGELTARVCTSCGQCNRCWNTEHTQMYQVVFRFLQQVQKGADVEMCSRELKSTCMRASVMMEETLRVFERARLNRAWYNRLLENREVIAQQLQAMSYIMKDCARSYENLSKKEGQRISAVRFRLRELGVSVQQVEVWKNPMGKLELQVTGRSKYGNCISMRGLAKELSRVTDWNLVSRRENRTLLGKEMVVMRFVEDTTYTITQGLARLTREGEQISGDSFSFLRLEDGRFLMSLSDGMGCGVQACKESEMVIDLIEKFLEAGFDEETAIRMMNAAMVTHGEHNLFSTVDLAVFDLDQGSCRLWKVGGATTFICRQQQVESVVSTNLPTGVFPGLEIQRVERKLENGDFVIMVSDGVLEHLGVADPNQEVVKMLQELDTNHPGKMAKKLLERVLLYTGGRVKDDMTVLVSGIWEK